MKQTISFSLFVNAFIDADRNDCFSYNGKQAIYDYLIDYEAGTKEEIELDAISICVEYTEYDDIEEALGNYDFIENIEDLEDHTTVLELGGGGIIVQDF